MRTIFTQTTTESNIFCDNTISGFDFSVNNCVKGILMSDISH